MFILLKILVVTDESILTNTYIEKDDLVSMFHNAPTAIMENLYFPFETPKRNLATILREHLALKKPQKVILGKKQGRSAKCRACRKEFSCAKPACTNSLPKWTDVCKVTEDNIATKTEIEDEEKEEVMRQFRF